MALHRGTEHSPHNDLHCIINNNMNTVNAVNPAKTAYIFGASEIGSVENLVDRNGYIIAADGGLSSVRKLGLTPNIALGDFDSLGYVPKGEYKTDIHPIEKDDTDMGLAVKRAISMGYKRLFLLGGLGGNRPDHTLANLQTLIYSAKNGACAFLTDGRSCFTAISAGQKLCFPENYRGELSVFSAEGISEGVTLKGLKYELENATLSGDFPLGVSNSFIDKSSVSCGKSQRNATVSVKKGSLWICFRCEEKNEKEYPTVQNL